MRLFIALHLPSEVQAAVAQAQDGLRRELVSSALKWTRPESTHLTLLFLGEVAEGDVPQLVAKLRTACELSSVFHLKLSGAGCFPNTRRPKVLWLDLEDDLDLLQMLHARVLDECDIFTERRDNKPFRPHLTMARISFDDKSITRRTDQVLSRLQFDAISWRAESVELMSSELLASGAKYSVIASIPLQP